MRRFLNLAVGLGLWLVGSAEVFAETPTWMPQDAVLQIRVERPLAALEHPLVREVWQAVLASPVFQIEQSAVDGLRFQQARELFESSAGLPWQTGLDKLVYRAWLSASRPNGGEGRPPAAAIPLVLVLETQDEALLERLMAAGHNFLAQQNPPLRPQSRRAADRDYFQLGEAFYARVGRFLLVTNRSRAMETLLSAATSLPTDAAPPSFARLAFDLDVAGLQTIPQFSQKPKWPLDNPGLVTLAGGYVDLVMRAKRLYGELRFEADGISLSMDTDVGTAGLPPGVAGFFATAAAAPSRPLTVPDMLYSASWVRDFAPIWTHRRELMTEGSLSGAEKEYDKQRGRYGFGPEEVTSWLGVRWRAVIARQGKTVYRRQPKERLPALAIAVDLREEGDFLAKIFPAMDRAVRGPITLVFGYPKNTEHRGATITSVRIKEPEGEPEVGDFRYSVSPAMTATRGHIVIGTTEEIVHQVIDDLERQASEPPQQLPPGTTDLQRLSFRELGTLASEFRDFLLREIVLEGGLTLAEAEQNSALITSLLNKLGDLTSTTTITANRFTITVRLSAK